MKTITIASTMLVEEVVQIAKRCELYHKDYGIDKLADCSVHI
jgi:hypothetical protein